MYLGGQVEGGLFCFLGFFNGYGYDVLLFVIFGMDVSAGLLEVAWADKCSFVL